VNPEWQLTFWSLLRVRVCAALAAFFHCFLICREDLTAQIYRPLNVLKKAHVHLGRKNFNTLVFLNANDIEKNVAKLDMRREYEVIEIEINNTQMNEGKIYFSLHKIFEIYHA
jgi:hypothetical protein